MAEDKERIQRWRDVAAKYLKRRDGKGKEGKQYWMTQQECIRDRSYTFSNITLQHDHAGHELNEEIWDIALEILGKLEITYDRNRYGIFIVVVAYVNQGVRAHQDNDYDTDDGRIISVTLEGQAKFHVAKPTRQVDPPIETCPGSVITFHNRIFHSADACIGKRVNMTIRFAPIRR
jgi:hypothetical protein